MPLRPIKADFYTTLFRKFVMAVSGLALVAYLAIHLFGNLRLLSGNGTAFNRYASVLESWGWVLGVIEAGLLIVFLVHIVTALLLARVNREARPIRYRHSGSKGGPPTVRSINWSSKHMVISGLIVLVFLALHVWQMRFAPTAVPGDLYFRVTEVFKNPITVAFYVVAVALLGFHLHHGFWSAFQSLGFTDATNTRILHRLSVLLALVFALGFMILPVFIYWRAA